MASEIVMIQMRTTGKKVSIIRNRKRQSEEVFQQLRYKLKKNNFILTEKHPDIGSVDRKLFHTPETTLKAAQTMNDDRIL